jgi:hypothetical protein
MLRSLESPIERSTNLKSEETRQIKTETETETERLSRREMSRGNQLTLLFTFLTHPSLLVGKKQCVWFAWHRKSMGSNFGDVEIEFDFETVVRESILPQIAETPSTQNTFGLGNFGRVDPKLRTVVCLYWLLGLCQKVSLLPSLFFLSLLMNSLLLLLSLPLSLCLSTDHPLSPSPSLSLREIIVLIFINLINQECHNANTASSVRSRIVP